MGVLFDPPKCKITNISRVASPDHSPVYFKITVQNVGSGATAYNIGCEIRLKKGNFIVDQSTAYFGYLKEGESTSGEADFYSITNLYEYSTEEITLYWYDSQDGYYQN